MPVWLEACIAAAAIAIVIQVAALLAVLLQVRKAVTECSKMVKSFQSRCDPILTKINRIVEDSEDRVASIMGDAAEVTRLARGQAQKVDRVFTESLERLRIQIIRADRILTGTLEVIEDTGSKVRSTLWGPVQQASAVIKGLKTGLEFFRNQQRRGGPDSESATQDEELFI
ncbi:MAG: hypothetical protein ACRD4S_08325 [Candidatus Acidiferrales bacterium]